jgi:nicotinamidase-related amidase
MMAFPSFYDPQKVGVLYVPRTGEAVDAGRSAGITPAEHDRERVLLLLVDEQVDFVHADGALSVPGAVEDTRRLIEWLFGSLPHITHIVASLDTHYPLQIFFPTWWADAEGRHPAPFTLITASDVERGRWRPLVEPEWSAHYVHRLEEQARKTLTIWPFHTMFGTPGHAITPALYEAITYHAAARRTETLFVAKGSIPRTEHYSILEPEVKVPDEPGGMLNMDLITLIAGYDRVFIAGQAKSHCVLETIHSLVAHFSTHDPAQIGKWHVLTDCMSSVAHPQVDFEALAAEQLRRFEAQGVHLVTSDQNIG